MSIKATVIYEGTPWPRNPNRYHSQNTIHTSIHDMSNDIKQHVTAAMKKSRRFSLKLHEQMIRKCMAQHMYTTQSQEICKKNLFYQPLTTIKTGRTFLEKHTSFRGALTWNQCLCALWGTSNLQSKIRLLWQSTGSLSAGEIFYRLPHRENPDSRMLLDNSNTLTKEVIHNVNFIPSEVFKQLNTFTLSW